MVALRDRLVVRDTGLRACHPMIGGHRAAPAPGDAVAG